jgi:tetratricopeptide (TPR) repeat protein
VIVVSTWSMRADRYLLPVLPVLLLFATAFVGEAIGSVPASRWPKPVKAGTAAAWIVIMAVPTVVDYPGYLRSVRTDTRTEAARWIEANIRSGSYLVIEPYGPEVLGPMELSMVNSAIRNAATALQQGKPNYAVLWLPMFQVAPERSEVFYDHALYENADYFVSSGSVRSRYEGEPHRFRRQLAFYDILEAAYESVVEFTPNGGGGPEIRIYKNRQHTRPFSARRVVAPPRLLRHGRNSPTGSEELFYYNLGINYEVFLRLQEAADSYEMAFRYPVTDPASYVNLALRRSQCLASMGRHDEAIEFLDAILPRAPTPAVRDVLQRVRNVIADERGPSGS